METTRICGLFFACAPGMARCAYPDQYAQVGALSDREMAKLGAARHRSSSDRWGGVDPNLRYSGVAT